MRRADPQEVTHGVHPRPQQQLKIAKKKIICTILEGLASLTYQNSKEIPEVLDLKIFIRIGR